MKIRIACLHGKILFTQTWWEKNKPKDTSISLKPHIVFWAFDESGRIIAEAVVPTIPKVISMVAVRGDDGVFRPADGRVGVRVIDLDDRRQIVPLLNYQINEAIKPDKLNRRTLEKAVEDLVEQFNKRFRGKHQEDLHLLLSLDQTPDRKYSYSDLEARRGKEDSLFFETEVEI
ncbi:MAG: hypothetical protein ABH829_01260 [archaeon]